MRELSDTHVMPGKQRLAHGCIHSSVCYQFTPKGQLVLVSNCYLRNSLIRSKSIVLKLQTDPILIKYSYYSRSSQRLLKLERGAAISDICCASINMSAFGPMTLEKVGQAAQCHTLPMICTLITCFHMARPLGTVLFLVIHYQRCVCMNVRSQDQHGSKY